MKNNKKVLSWSLLVIVLVIVAGFYFYCTSGVSMKTPPSTTETQPKTTQSGNNPTPASADWKTYTDSAHTFTINHPASWKIDVVSDSYMQGGNPGVKLSKNNYSIIISSLVAGSHAPDLFPFSTANSVIYPNQLLPNTFLSRSTQIALTDIGDEPFFDIHFVVKQPDGSYKAEDSLVFKGNFYYLYFGLPKSLLTLNSSGAITGDSYNGIYTRLDTATVDEANQILSSFKLLQ